MVQAPPRGANPGQGGWSPGGDDWAPATHFDVAQTPYVSRAERGGSAEAERRRAAAREWGLPGWGGLLVLVAICAIGGLVDLMNGPTLAGGFNVSLVIASGVAILVVRRHAMFPVVIAPPLVYAFASAVVLYFHLRGAKNRRSLLIDAAANWLVYGFPAIAGATAVVLIVAGIRMVIRR